MALADPKHTLYLLDISSFIFRAFFAIRVLHNKKGEPTNAVLGVANMLAKLIEEATPEYLGVCYDSREPSFRDKIFEEYKANRSAPPDDLAPQFARIDQLIEGMGIHSFRAPGFEADDLIATLTRRWLEESPGHEVIIVSGDKDLMQLVGSRVRVWDTMKNVVFGPDEVRGKFGVGPEKVRDFLSLTGDSSDNIPGVEGIGPKGATELLTTYGTLDGILKAAQEGLIKGKRGETLKKSIERAELSRKLVTLEENCPVDFSTEQFRYQFGLSVAGLDLLKELDFKALAEKWSPFLRNGKAVKGAEKSIGSPDSGIEEQNRFDFSEKLAEVGSDKKFRSIQSERDFQALIEQLQSLDAFVLDLETTSLNPRAAEIVGLSFCWNSDWAVYVPIGHKKDGERVSSQLDAKKVLHALKPILENPKIGKVGQNIKYDYSVLLENGISMNGIAGDTMLAAYVVDPTGRHGMDYLSEKYLDYTPLSYAEICGKGKDEISFSAVEIGLATFYSAEDAWVTYRLWKLLDEKLKELSVDGELLKVYRNIDLPMVRILADMECLGVRIDTDWLAGLSKKFEGELKTLESQVEKHANGVGKSEINLNSPKQLAEFLFDDLKLPVQKKTKTGYSTDAGVLQKLAVLHEVPMLLLEYREISKLKGTYVDPLPRLVDPKDGRLHGSFHLTVAATGRLASSDPNLQNIPARTQRGQEIRRAFVASPGNVLYSADYSQIELRILAHMSEDPDLLDSFNRDDDVHRRTASEIFGKPANQVTDEQRGIAKAINFGLMYGKTAFGLAEELNISRSEAKTMIDRYFTRYHKVKTFLDGLIALAKKEGSVRTLYGRVRPLPEIHSSNGAIRANAERMAMNSPIQGTAADLMKLAMIRLDHALREEKLQSKMIIQVHDEILLEVPKAELSRIEQVVPQALSGAAKFKVPLKVNGASGMNWKEL